MVNHIVNSRRERKEVEAPIEQVTGQRTTEEAYDQVSDEIHRLKDAGQGGTRNDKVTSRRRNYETLFVMSLVKAAKKVGAMSTLVSDSEAADIRVSLVIRGFDADPDTVTSELGLEPSVAGKKGDPYKTVAGKPTSRRNSQSYWVLNSGLPRAIQLEEQVRGLLRVVSEAAPGIAAVRAPVKQIFCTIIPNGPVPLLSLGSDSLRGIAALNCELRIDVLHIDPDDKT